MNHLQFASLRTWWVSETWGSPVSYLSTSPMLQSIDIEIERPTFLAGGERTRGSDADGDMLLVGGGVTVKTWGEAQGD